MDLKIARQIARLTQRQLADRSGVDESTISLIETDKRDYEVVSYRDIVKLARALHVELALLFPVADEGERLGTRGARSKETRRDSSSHA